MSKSIIRKVEKALGLTLGVAWVGWHVARYCLHEAQETLSALRGRLSQIGDAS